MKNPNCDNDKCISSNSEIRILPTGGNSNALLCRACFNHEILFRIKRNEDLNAPYKFKLPAYNDLKIYGE